MYYLHILDYENGTNNSYTYNVPPDDIEQAVYMLNHNPEKCKWLISKNPPQID